MLKSYICNKLGCNVKNELFKPQTSKTSLSSMPEWSQEFAGHVPVHRSLSEPWWPPVVTRVQQLTRELEKKVIFHIKCKLYPWICYQHGAGLCLYLLCRAEKYNKPGALESSKDLSLHLDLVCFGQALRFHCFQSSRQNEAQWGRNVRDWNVTEVKRLMF